MKTSSIQSGASTEETLCDELEVWCKANGLPLRSADELLSSGVNTNATQRAWLAAYIERWNATVEPHAASQAAHTPTPWRLDRSGSYAHKDVVTDTDLICRAFSDQGINGDANAAFIVRACNSHAALVEALSNLTAACESALNFTRKTVSGPVREHRITAIAQARAALASLNA